VFQDVVKAALVGLRARLDAVRDVTAQTLLAVDGGPWTAETMMVADTVAKGLVPDSWHLVPERLDISQWGVLVDQCVAARPNQPEAAERPNQASTAAVGDEHGYAIDAAVISDGPAFFQALTLSLAKIWRVLPESVTMTFALAPPDGSTPSQPHPSTSVKLHRELTIHGAYLFGAEWRQGTLVGLEGLLGQQQQMHQAPPIQVRFQAHAHVGDVAEASVGVRADDQQQHQQQQQQHQQQHGAYRVHIVASTAVHLGMHSLPIERSSDVGVMFVPQTVAAAAASGVRPSHSHIDSDGDSDGDSDSDEPSEAEEMGRLLASAGARFVIAAP
jgi:hypothetical protein